ncbi:MAG TPA: site-2 protease family protein [Polyangiales bacterium]|nr:site-2 protease family protein [Polyangiales bacterium]
MGRSYRIGRIAGIDIKLHWTFPLIFVFAAIRWGPPHGMEGVLFGALLTVLLFACVVLHELGHSLAARAVGVPVQDITLLPIGGVAQLNGRAERPLHELGIALGLAAFVGTSVLARPDASTLNATLAAPSLDTLLRFLLISNIGLAVFNMLPVFPLDGGQALRAVLAMAFDRARATRIATLTGRFGAVALGAVGVSSGNLLLAVIAVFLFLGAASEHAYEGSRSALARLRVGDSHQRGLRTLSPNTTVEAAAKLALETPQRYFPVLLFETRLRGIVSRNDLTRALAHGAFAAPVSEFAREVPTLDAQLTLDQARERLLAAGSHVGAVFDGDTFSGLMSLSDLADIAALAASLPDGKLGRPTREAA